MRPVTKLLSRFALATVGVCILVLPAMESAMARPRNPYRTTNPANTVRRTPEVSGNSSTHTNVQVDTSGANNVRQNYNSQQSGGGIQNSTSVQLNYSGCAGQNSSQTASQRQDGVGAAANASVSVCNPANKLPR
ncbi:MAG: hypothetical protein ACK5QS_00890 [Pseudanabaenaceae cyanobacterium]|jgi:hypothetical protein